MPSLLPFFGPSTVQRAALTTFFNLEAAAQASIKQGLKEVGYPFRRRKLKDEAKRLHEELKVLDAETLFSILDTITDLLPIPDDFREEALEEMVKETAIPLPSLRSLVNELSTEKRFIESKAVEAFKGLAIPGLAGIEYFCAMKTRFDKQFQYFEDKIEDYKPRVVDNHPVVVVMAQTRGREPEELTFQLDEEGLNKLISELIAAQRELKIVASKLKASDGE